MKTGLVISGGGDKGAFAVGALEVLLDHGCEFDLIAGTSTGALIAPMTAIGDIDELVRIYTNVTKSNVLRLNWRRLFLNAIWDTKPLERLIRKTMTDDRFDRLMHTETEVLLCSVGFQTGELYYYSQRGSVEGSLAWSDYDEFVSAILASTNEPMVMPPVSLRGEPCFDGGVREIAPLEVMLSAGAEKVFVIANSPEHVDASDDQFKRMTKIGPRAISIMTREILNNDIYGDLWDERCTLIRPQSSLPTSGMDFEPEAMRKMREIGREEAKRVLGAS